MIKISIPYSIIVTNSKLCEEFWVNEWCVNEGIVDGEDTYTTEINEDNIWILDELIDAIIH